MILHTICPIDMVFPEDPSAPKMTCVDCEFGIIQGYDSPEGTVISRIISTDLSVYLNPSYSPGSIYKSPIKK